MKIKTYIVSIKNLILSWYNKIKNAYSNTIEGDSTNDTRQLLSPKILSKEDFSYKCVEELEYATSQASCNNVAVAGIYAIILQNNH